MPTFSHLFGLTPSDIFALTPAEYRSYTDAANEYADANS